MAKNVVLKDIDGNVLMPKLYTHFLLLFIATEEVDLQVIFSHYSFSNEPFNNAEDLKNVMALDLSLSCIIQDAGDTGINFSGFIEFRENNVWVGTYNNDGPIKEATVTYSEISIDDTVK